MAPRKSTTPTVSDVASQPAGTNVMVAIENGKAILTIDLSARGGESSTGKTISVATTHGNFLVPGTEVKIGLNAFVKK